LTYGIVSSEVLSDCQSEINRRIDTGAMSAAVGGEYSLVFEEVSCPERTLCNSFMMATRQLIFEWLPELAREHEKTAIAMLPGADWNAFAWRLPSGRPLIVVDYGATALTRPVASLVWDFLMSCTDNPDAERQGECAQGLVLIALYLRTRNPHFLVPAFALARNAMNPANWLNNTCNLMHMFVLLHEYGHVSLRHQDLVAADHRADGGLMRFALQQGMEFEADQYAVEQLTRAWNNRTSIGFVPLVQR
jgi:hypothetical protein